jgi:hypothetical protein
MVGTKSKTDENSWFFEEILEQVFIKIDAKQIFEKNPEIHQT